MIDENLGIFLKDFGVACSSGATPFVAIVDAPGQMLTMGGVQVQTDDYSLVMQTSDVQAAGLVQGVAVNVLAGTHAGAYVVRDPLMLEDGAFSVVTLSK